MPEGDDGIVTNQEFKPQVWAPWSMSPASRQRLDWCCVIRFGSIGDNLIASSVLPLLSDKYNVEVIAQSPTHTVFENNPHISKLTVKEPGSVPPIGTTEWHKWTRDRTAEYKGPFIHLSHSVEQSLAFFPAQVQFSWSAEQRRRWAGKSYLEMAHDIAGVEYTFNPRFYPTDAELQKAIETKQKIGPRTIGWCCSGSRLDKVQPAAPIIVARLLRETGLPVILFGTGDKDYAIAKQIQDWVLQENGTLNGLFAAILPGTVQQTWSDTGEAKIKLGEEPKQLWPIRRSLSQLQGCDLVISPDTGLAWGVAMERMPKIVMLGHASPENITKHWYNTVTLIPDQRRVPCWPCHCLHDSMETCIPNSTNSGAACISDISVSNVVETAKALLGGASGS